MVLCLILLTMPLVGASSFPSYSQQRQAAAAYLKAAFNPNISLIHESEDQGRHWLSNEIPAYRWRYNETYWLYSDNLIAYHAIEPFYPDIAAKISLAIQGWRVPPSGKFESLFGTPVGPDRGAHDYIVFSSFTGTHTRNLDFAIMIRVHNGTIPSIHFTYADVLIYRALSSYWMTDRNSAQALVRKAASLWNGTCIVDSGVHMPAWMTSPAPSDFGTCQNFKIAIILYGAIVTGTHLERFDEMRNFLWTQQLPNGGIATLSRDGRPLGSANSETTSLTLLPYNSAMIAELSENSYPIPEGSGVDQVILPMLVLIFLLGIRRKRY